MIFNTTIFGPIHSRRLGISLGINLMPNDGKLCSFDCVYCEAGLNSQGPGTSGVPSRETVKRLLSKKLAAMSEAGEALDVITFSGNGEPTLHPQFAGIIHDTLTRRDHYYPTARVSVLSNATMIDRADVVKALKTVDNNILKLDSAIASTLRAMNRPVSANVLPAGIIENLKQFAGSCVIQTMLLRGVVAGVTIDNTTDIEVNALIAAYKAIQPREVQLYSLDRTPPEAGLETVTPTELEAIADKMRAAGINARTYC